MSELDQKSEIGHVRHVPKPPSEGETLQQNNTYFQDVFFIKSMIFQTNDTLYSHHSDALLHNLRNKNSLCLDLLAPR